MPNLLEDLIIDRVDLVDEGANSEAFIELFKRKGKNMNYTEVMAQLTAEQSAPIKAEFDRLNGEITVLKAKPAPAPTEEDIIKSMPEAAQKVFQTLKVQKEAAEETLRKSKEVEKEAVAVAKAATLKSLPIEQKKLVEIIKSASTDVLDLLSAAAASIDATVLSTVGKEKGAANNPDSAWSKIETKATEIAKSKNISQAKAISQVVEENPDLYKEYLQGGAN